MNRQFDSTVISYNIFYITSSTIFIPPAEMYPNTAFFHVQWKRHSAFANKMRCQYEMSIYSIRSHSIPIAFLPCGPSRHGVLPFALIRVIPTRFQIEAITRARQSIFIQKPNLTSRAIIKTLKQPLLKAIQVTIYLPHNIASLVTGWSTTKCRVRLLQK